MWDSTKVGAGPPPLRIPEGWLEIYHGVDQDQRYCLGAVLLDADEPDRVLGRSLDPIMEPLANYEIHGFFGKVIFATGAVAEDDRLTSTTALLTNTSAERPCQSRRSSPVWIE
jgi:beta-1,2-mannobiose phosphorylase / 1,2-beta-oligomannan phosphorylase